MGTNPSPEATGSRTVWIMADPDAQRKNPFGKIEIRSRSVGLNAVARHAADLMLADLLAALGTAAETGLTGFLLTRSRLHDTFLLRRYENGAANPMVRAAPLILDARTLQAMRSSR